MAERGGVAARRDGLRSAVLAVADARVANAGLADLGVREIAREAGCSAGMVYKLFESHDDLVLAVNANTLRALAAAMAERLRGIDDPADALCAMADAYLDYAAANSPRWNALFAHRQTGGNELPAWYAELRDQLLDGIASTIGPAPPTARTLFSAVQGVVALGLQQKVGPVSLEALRGELRALVTAVAVACRTAALETTRSAPDDPFPNSLSIVWIGLGRDLPEPACLRQSEPVGLSSAAPENCRPFGLIRFHSNAQMSDLPAVRSRRFLGGVQCWV